jgi:DNA gyrase subunit A
MGRSARGVKGMKVRDDDYVVGVSVVDEEKQLLTITEQGFGKRTPFTDLKVKKNRGGSGVQCHNITDKTGLLCSIATVSDKDDLMMITDGGTIIRTPVKDIPSYSRAASGVIVMRLDEGRSLVNFAICPNEEEAEEQAAAANAEIRPVEVDVDPSEIHVPEDVIDADSDFE